MTRLPGPPGAAASKPAPDVYTALLLAAILFLLIAIITVFLNLTQNYGLSIGQIFAGGVVPD